MMTMVRIPMEGMAMKSGNSTFGIRNPNLLTALSWMSMAFYGAFLCVSLSQCPCLEDVQGAKTCKAQLFQTIIARCQNNRYQPKVAAKNKLLIATDSETF